MTKTGESYTTARAHVLSRRPAAQPPAPSRTDADLAGMSDDKVAAKTARTWIEWVRTLDADGAASMSHREIAVLVGRKYRIGSWWAQTVTVGYERIKGLRDRGQRLGGTYEATKSRTFGVPVTTLFDAWVDDNLRRRWLGNVQTRVRRSTAPRSIRLQWPGGAIIAVGFTPKGAAKSTVALSHPKLCDKTAVDEARQWWAERLDALAGLLAGSR
jgi:hypothetical protein